MTKKEEREHRKLLDMYRDVRVKTRCDFWLIFSRYFRPWIHELTRIYKERGWFEPMAAWLLPSKYTEPNDIEIAAFAALLIKDDDRMNESVSEFRIMFGRSPYEWFKNREFVSLSIGKRQEERTGGVLNRKIAELFSQIYDRWDDRMDSMPSILHKMFGEERCLYKLDMLRLVLGTSDGFGLGVWTIMPQDIKTPLSDETRGFLRTFFPDYTILKDVYAAIHLFGFENDYDFFYAFLAYKELCRRDPEGCSFLATIYTKRYRENNTSRKTRWVGAECNVFPDLDLFK